VSMTSPWCSHVYRDRRVLVLGASGFIGQSVARMLANAQAKVYSAVRGSARDLPGVISGVDLSIPGTAANLISALCPDIVFNLAGYGIDRTERDAALARRINAELPGEAAAAAIHTESDSWSGLRFVHVGSALEYGVASGDLDEESEPNPTTLYGQTKLAGAQAVSQVGEGCVTARLFTVYGTGEIKGRLLPSLIDAARTGSHLPLTDGLQKRHFTYVGDVAEGLLRMGSMRWPPEGPLGRNSAIVNLATDKLLTVKHFVLEAARVIGLRSSQLGFGELLTREEEMSHLPVTMRRLRQWTGWYPMTEIAKGVEETIGAYV